MRTITALLSVLFALGVFLMIGGLTGFLAPLVARAGGEGRRLREMDVKGGLAFQVQSILRRDPQRDELLLYQAGYPGRYRTLADFYAWKVLGAGVGFLAGVLLASRTGWWFMPLVLGMVGLFAPDRDLQRHRRRRLELLVTEMAFRLNDLAILVAGGKTPEGALQVIASQPGGPFTREMEAVMREYRSGVDILEALRHFADRWPDSRHVQTFVEAVTGAVERGYAVADVLRGLGEDFLDELRGVLLEEGLAALVKMQAFVTLLILVATVIALLAPFREVIAVMLGG